MNTILKFAIIALVAAPLTGCLGLFGADEPAATGPSDEQLVTDKIGDKAQERLQILADTRPRTFLAADQNLLPPVTVWYNDSVGTQANTAIEAKDDKGGINYGSVVKALDVASYMPPGQPTEVRIQLFWNAQEGESLDYDIYVDVPGMQTEFFPKSEEFNWNIPTKTMSINTVGAAGENHLIGVEANNGRTTTDVPFTMRLDFRYTKNVVTPFHAWGFTVPANASGIVIESDKVAGDETITAEFVIIDPNDQLVQFVQYNDIAIPTESVFIPLNSGPGEYIFYAHSMRGGFFRISSDSPLDAPALRKVPLVRETVMAITNPTPGVAERDWAAPVATGAATPLTGAQDVPFAVDASFPLAVHAVVDGSGAVQGMIHARITSSKGIVHDLQRIIRYDDAQGSIGYTGDEGQANQYNAGAIAKGAFTLSVVNDSNASVGYSILTYKR